VADADAEDRALWRLRRAFPAWRITRNNKLVCPPGFTAVEYLTGRRFMTGTVFELAAELEYDREHS
jgi:hypothetical protein